MTNFLKSLKLPSFPQNPSNDPETLKEQIASYVRTVLGRDFKNISRLINLAKLHVSDVVDTGLEGIEVSWIDIIRLLSIQKLEERMREPDAFSSFVVYDRNEMYKFLTEPWWLTMDVKSVALSQKNQSLMATLNEMQSSKKRKSTEDMSMSSDEVSKILKTGEATLKKLESRNKTYKDSYVPDKRNVVSVFHEAESYFEENKLLWKRYENKLFGSSS